MISVFWVECIALLFLLALSGFFSSSETAFFSLNRLRIQRIRKYNPPAADQVEWIKSSPTRLLSTILIGNTFVNVAIASLSFGIVSKIIERDAEAIAVALSLFLLLIFGEIGPKRVAVAYPERVATLYAGPLKVFIFLLKPLRIFLEFMTEQFTHHFQPRGDILSKEELTTVVAVSAEEGVLDEKERAMVKGLNRLETLQVSDVMTPRLDIIAVDIGQGREEIVKLVKNAGVRKVPLYKGDLENIDGCIDTRLLLLDPQHRIRNAWSAPLYVPEFASLEKLFNQFLRHRERTAVVVDEYGGIAGIVTRGDVLEEITGDIVDEFGRHELLFDRIGPNRWLIDGRVSLEELNERFGYDLEEEGVDRVAGWIAARLDRIPRTGDAIDGRSCQLIVRQMRRNRITRVELLAKGKSGE
jgi:putative hemolysin